MKCLSKVMLAAVSLAAVLGCADKKPRVAIVGIGIECSTFSPARTTLDMFEPILYGQDIIESYPFFQDNEALLSRADWVPTIMAWATPGGMVTRDCYDTLVNRSLRMLKEGMPYDGIFLDIHGAMSVEGLEDPEGDYITRIREVVGPDVLISASMDPHGCVSPTLAKGVDLITSYRMAPHTDRYISRERAIVNLLDRLESGKGKPAYKAWVKVPILLPGEKTSTRVEPGKSLYAAIEPIEAQDGVIDAAIWMSYPWADEPRNHGVVVVTGDDSAQVTDGARQLAEHFWSVRNDFEFVAPTASLEEVLEKAIKSDKKPYFISDMGDNPTAGGAGDVTWTLQKLLDRPEFKKEGGKTLVYSAIPGPEMVAQAKEVGEGGHVRCKVGAAVDNRYAPPVMLDGTVVKILDRETNDQVVVKVGSMLVVVGEERSPYHYKADYEALGIDPYQVDIIVNKLGYLTEELYDISLSGDWMMAQTRGGVDQDLLQLPYQHLQRPIFPLDPDMPDPDFEVVYM